MLNLRYGQQAVSRGFITPQRLQQVLAKQRALSDQGKKVSVRMILEKSKLLTPDQLDQLDRDLNIKVVKKKTTTIQKSAVQQRPTKTQAVTAENFFGDEALPDVSGTQNANPDATIYSPPPPDMQERIRQEREKAKAAVRQKHDQQAGGPSRQAPQPQRGQPQPQFAAMEPEMEPEPFAQDAAPELERMDSSPKLESLPAEFSGIAAPEDEGLPSLDAGGGFDQFGEAPQQGGFDNLAPAEQGFDQFGEAPQQGGDMFSGTGQLGAEPEPSSNWGEDAQASPFAEGSEAAPIDQTLYSPPPSRGRAPEPAPLAQSFDNFGEDESPAAPAFGDDAAMPGGDEINATLYSPPPADYAPQAQPEAEPEMMAEPEPFADEAPEMGEPEPVAPPAPQLKQPPAPTVSGRKLPPGKKKVDDFSDSGVEAAPALDDVPTVKPRGEPVHPLRRGVSSEIDALKAAEPPPASTSSRKASSGRNVKAAEPAIELPEDEEPAPAVQAKAPSKPEPKSKAKGGKEPAKAVSNTPTATAEPPKKKSKARTLLLFVFMLLIVIAALVVPVVPEAQEKIPELRQFRNHEQAHVVFDYVENWANQVRGQFQLPPWKTGKTPMKAPIDGVPTPVDGQSGDGTKAPEEKPPEKPPEEAKPDAQAQWKALYKAGATWVVRANWGSDSWTKTEVISVDGTKARIKVSTKTTADGEFENPTESDSEYTAPAAEGEPNPKWKELAKGEDVVAGLDCTWIEGEFDGKRIKTWTSKKFGPWLMVKSEMEAGKQEVVEFKEGQ